LEISVFTNCPSLVSAPIERHNYQMRGKRAVIATEGGKRQRNGALSVDLTDESRK
jgi:hypothetical protein